MSSIGDRTAPATAAPERVEAPAASAPAPAASEVVETKTVDTTTSDDSNLFTDIANDDLSAALDGPASVAPAAPVAKPQPAVPVAQPAAAPAQSAAPQPPAQPAASTPAQPEAVQPAPQPQPAAPQETPDQLAAKRAEHRAQAVAKIQESYALNEEDAAKLVVEPEKIIPRLLANAHAQILDNVWAMMQNALPTMIQHTQRQTEQSAKSVGQFFDAWPELNNPQYKPTIARVLQGYRASNPQATTEDVIREGGVMALVALRLPLPARVTNNAHMPDAARPGAFPAVHGSAVARPPAKPSDNVFTVIAEEDLVERAG